MKRFELSLIFLLFITLYDSYKQQSNDDDSYTDIDDDNMGNLPLNDSESDKRSGIYFLGFGKYAKEAHKISFRMYFKSINSYYPIDDIKFSLIIYFKNRFLIFEEEKEETNANCKLFDNIYSTNITLFDCEAYITKDKDIKSIKSKRDYNTRKGEFKFIESSNSINANIAKKLMSIY